MTKCEILKWAWRKCDGIDFSKFDLVTQNRQVCKIVEEALNLVIQTPHTTTTGKGPMEKDLELPKANVNADHPPRQNELFERLDQIEQRANAATLGPWFGKSHVANLADVISNEGPIASVSRWTNGLAGSDEENRANLEFIAAARSDLPALVKALRRAIETIRRYQSWHYYPDRVNELSDIAQLLSAPSVGRGNAAGAAPLPRSVTWTGKKKPPSASPASTQGETTDTDRLDRLQAHRHFQLTYPSSAWPEEYVVMTNPMNGTGPVFHHDKDVRKAIDAALSPALPLPLSEETKTENL
jgi:hypothetical protein